MDPFEPGSLGWLLPWAETGEGDVLTPDEALEVFLEWVDARGMELWPHQEDALMDLAVGDSVTVSYTHLDVYKRQVLVQPPGDSWLGRVCERGTIPLAAVRVQRELAHHEHFPTHIGQAQVRCV